MSDHQQPEPDDADLDVTARPGSAGPRQRSRSGLPALGLVAAMVVALVAGPAVASRLASTGAVSPGTYPDAGRLTEPGVPLPTLRPASTPCSTGENANQREGRSAFPTPTPTPTPTPMSTGENANQREGRSAFPTPTPTGEPGCP